MERLICQEGNGVCGVIRETDSTVRRDTPVIVAIVVPPFRSLTRDTARLSSFARAMEAFIGGCPEKSKRIPIALQEDTLETDNYERVDRDICSEL